MAQVVGHRVWRWRAALHRAAVLILLAALAALVALPASPVRADLFVLRDGGQVEGDEVGRTDQVIQIRTRSAQVAVAADQVVRIEKNPVSWQVYQKLQKEYPQTADGHYRLALWCRQHDLEDYARQELHKALALDADHADSHRALGHVRIGDAWLDPAAKPAPASPPGEPRKGPATRPGDPQRAMDAARTALRNSDRDMIAMLRAEWVKRLRSIQSSYLASSLKQQFNLGAEMVRAIRDPLAVEPMLQVLRDGPLEQRKLLMVALGEIHASAATMALLEAAVLDDDADIRRAAMTQLRGRSDPRILAFLLRLLTSEDDDVVRNAAEAIGQLRLVDAMPALIKDLTGQQTRRVQTDDMVRILRQDFIDSNGQLRTMYIRRRISDPFSGPPSYRTVTVTVYRTQVQEALIAITGENYQFDSEAWTAWYRRYQAKQAAAATGPAPR